ESAGYPSFDRRRGDAGGGAVARQSVAVVALPGDAIGRGKLFAGCRGDYRAGSRTAGEAAPAWHRDVNALSGRAAVRYKPYQAAGPAAPQPDRPAPNRRAPAKGRRHRLLLDEFRRSGGSTSLNRRSPSWQAMVSKLPDRPLAQSD